MLYTRYILLQYVPVPYFLIVSLLHITTGLNDSLGNLLPMSQKFGQISKYIEDAMDET
jgi:hypothetical protein